MRYSISEFVIPLCCMYQVVLAITCMEYSKNMHLLALKSSIVRLHYCTHRHSPNIVYGLKQSFSVHY